MQSATKNTRFRTTGAKTRKDQLFLAKAQKRLAKPKNYVKLIAYAKQWRKKELKMIVFLFLACCAAGFAISRPIVRIFNI